MANEITLRKLKEGVDAVEVTEVLVKPGQAVEKDQALIVVNADKASMEVHAPMAGKVVELKVKPGDEIKVGAASRARGRAAGSPRRTSRTPSTGPAAWRSPRRGRRASRCRTSRSSARSSARR